jgi:hypothetical protein
MTRLHIIYLLFLFLYSLTTFGQTSKSNDYWLLFADTTKDEYGYKSQNGNTVIQLGKYNICFTDTFRTYAVVSKSSIGFVAIDRKQNILYKVFPFDNGPDYISDGLFRILKDNKIGYADATTGKVIIRPQFDCAFPFEDGFAKVSTNCATQSDGKHKVWTSNNWFYIDKKGKKRIKQHSN